MAVIVPHVTRAIGTVLTAAIYNTDHQAHITNANSLNTDLVVAETDINALEAKMGWELISSTVLTAAASFIAANLSAFRMLRVNGFLRPSAASVLALTTDTANGASFDVGASDYSWQGLYGTGTVSSAGFDAADTLISLTGTAGFGGNDGLAIHILMTEFNKAQNMFLLSRFFQTNVAVIQTGVVGGVRESAVARNAFRLIFPGGTMTGFLTLEGVRG